MRGATVLGLAAACVCAGCVYEREVSRRHPLAGLPGVKSATPETSRGWQGADPTYVPEDQLVVEQPGGQRTLVARSARHLMIHIYTTLRDGDEELFTEQVLSSITRGEYQARGLDAREAFRTLRGQSEDVVALFNLMPSGEKTPGVHWRTIDRTRDGRPIVRVSLGSNVPGMRWNFMDMVMESGNWRLRWFGRE
ncbi:MAG: hypothetical protein KIT19_14865 [Phycisphaeraceae bacterium]|nr:hypothetical protein [Phycisphaeraceae bacterium]MCW5755434.1 hypothetical protein [Phycisphaeraceae bacterium]MCW5769955.1 hypothetical protein [Phycisphaeraceae bacterium]